MATLETIPAQSGEAIRALLTLGAGAGASATNLRGTQSYVTQTGQVEFAGVPGMTLNGIHPFDPRAAQGAVRFRQRNGGFNTWRAIEGNDAVEVRIAVSTDGDTIRLGIQNSIGGGYWNWEFPGLPRTNTVGAGATIAIVISVPGASPTPPTPPTPVTRDTAGAVASGAPGVSVSAEKVEAEVRDTEAAITSGAPSVGARAEVVPADPATVHDTEASISAGAPSVSGEAEVIEAGQADAGGTVAAGAPVVEGRAETVGVQPPSNVGGDVETGAPEVDATAGVVAVPSETNVQLAWLAAGAWMPRTNPPRAVMPLVVRCQGATEDLCPAICRELDKKLEWCIFGETAIPVDEAPHGTITGASGQHVVVGVVVSLDVNQSLPEFEDGSPEPSISEVRILLTQPTTTDSDDLPLFIARRADLRRVLSRLTGGIGV